MKEQKNHKRLIRFTFHQQFKVCFTVFILNIILAHLFQTGVFHNFSRLICGVLFLWNPVWPETWVTCYPESQKLGARIAGAILIILGLICRFGI